MSCAVNMSPNLYEKLSARKIVIVMAETSGRGRRSVRHNNYIAADSSDKSVSYATSSVALPASKDLSSYKLSTMSPYSPLSYTLSRAMKTLSFVENYKFG